MALIKRLQLDVLKPHHPDALELAKALAALGPDYQVQLSVLEVDEQTQTVQLNIHAGAIDFEQIQQVLTTMGASLHSIDEVESHGESAAETTTL